MWQQMQAVTDSKFIEWDNPIDIEIDFSKLNQPLKDEVHFKQMIN